MVILIDIKGSRRSDKKRFRFLQTGKFLIFPFIYKYIIHYYFYKGKKVAKSQKIFYYYRVRATLDKFFKFNSEIFLFTQIGQNKLLKVNQGRRCLELAKESKNPKIITIATKISVEEKEELDNYCQENDITIAQLLRAALKIYLSC